MNLKFYRNLKSLIFKLKRKYLRKKYFKRFIDKIIKYKIQTGILKNIAANLRLNDVSLESPSSAIDVKGEKFLPVVLAGEEESKREEFLDGEIFVSV